MYYDKRDLWPMLVRAGFRPSQIRLRYHKFGLNLFCSCQEGRRPPLELAKLVTASTDHVSVGIY